MEAGAVRGSPGLGLPTLDGLGGSAPLSAELLLDMQRLAGNQAVATFLHRRGADPAPTDPAPADAAHEDAAAAPSAPTRAPAAAPPAAAPAPHRRRRVLRVAMPAPTVSVGGRRYSTFRIAGYTGLALGGGLGAMLTTLTGRSVAVLTLLVLLSAAVFLATAAVTRMLVGEDRLTYYHHQFTILGAASAFLALTSQPVLAYLDVIALGIGAFLACGRVGCLLVGCCHGRPARWGVSYGPAHCALGFGEPYRGVALLPVQAFEAACVAAVVAAGSVLVLLGASAGSALVWYLAAYGCARFWLEFVRGDPVRPIRAGFSAAQWTSFTLVGALAVSGLTGLLPAAGAPLAAAACVGVGMAAVASGRWLRRVPAHLLLGAEHGYEVAGALNRMAELAAAAAPAPAAPVVGYRTSLGIDLYRSRLVEGARAVEIYSIGVGQLATPRAVAAHVGELIGRVRGATGCPGPIEGRLGLFHLLVWPVTTRPDGRSTPDC